MPEWHIVAEGVSLDCCGDPQAYHDFHDGTAVWGPKQCTRRQCPVCADHRYVHDAADDIARTVMGWVAEKLSRKELYDKEGRSLKIYHFIYSRRESDTNLISARKFCRETLKRAGMQAGYNITHPYRGNHQADALPGEIRGSLDRSKLSIHIHGIAIGYWSEPQEDCYYHSDVIADIRTWQYEDAQIVTRDRIMAKLLYDLNHAGYYGDRGQCVSQWGAIGSDRLKPDQPGVWLKHPTLEYEGEPIWEKRNPGSHESWMELHNIIQDAMQDKYFGHQEVIWEEVIPNGHVQVFNPWYPLRNIETKPDHTTWYDWRATMAKVVISLISSHFGIAEGTG